MTKLINIKNNINQDIRIASIKQPIIKEIINGASLCNKIDCIILFGSSVEERCRPQSDIDLAIVTNVCLSQLIRTAGWRKFKDLLYSLDDNQEYDILYFRSLSEIQTRKELVCQDIRNNGQLLYKRIP